MDVPLVQALKTAVAEENLNALRHLCLNTTVDVAAEDNYAVRMASMMGNLPIVQFLCELPPERGVRPRIWWAAGEGHLHVVRYLCELPPERDVRPDALDNLAVGSAAERGHLNVVRYLCGLPLERGIQPDLAICWAAHEGHLDIVRYPCH